MSGNSVVGTGQDNWAMINGGSGDTNLQQEVYYRISPPSVQGDDAVDLNRAIEERTFDLLKGFSVMNVTDKRALLFNFIHTPPSENFAGETLEEANNTIYIHTHLSKAKFDKFSGDDCVLDCYF